MYPDKTDEEKLKAYNKKGYRKIYSFEKAYEFSVLKRAITAKIKNKRVVVRAGDTPHGKASVITVTNEQKRSYDIIVQYMDLYDATFLYYHVLRSAGIRACTLDALEDKKLIQMSDDGEVSLWKKPIYDAFMENAIRK